LRRPAAVKLHACLHSDKLAVAAAVKINVLQRYARRRQRGTMSEKWHSLEMSVSRPSGESWNVSRAAHA